MARQIEIPISSDEWQLLKMPTLHAQLIHALGVRIMSGPHVLWEVRVSLGDDIVYVIDPEDDDRDSAVTFFIWGWLAAHVPPAVE